jgi:regulator of protease activity HflC (stomatin/prohibitin superfamily)
MIGGMDFSALLSTALIVVTLATAGGFGLMRGRVTNLREDLADTRATNAELRTERTEDRALIDTLRAEADAEKAKRQAEREADKIQLDALAKVVTGEVHWTALGEHLDHHHTEAREHWTRAEDNTTEMLEALRAIREALTDR